MGVSARGARWVAPALLIVVWLVIGAVLGPYVGRIGDVATTDQSSFLPESAESTQVLQAQRAFQPRSAVPAIVVWESTGGAITPAQRAAATRALASLNDAPPVAGQVSPAVPAQDRRALRGVVPLRTELGEEIEPAVDRIRRAASQVPGTAVHIGGPAAIQADLSGAFAGIDALLLTVALTVVLLILLLVYRSVLLPLIIVGAVLALTLACAIVYALAVADVVTIDGQVQGILFILVIGASTDYSLLLTARFREELGLRGRRFPAIAAALRRSAGAIVASAATVALGLLALLLSDLSNTQALGPVGAIGIACALLSVLTFLPAALVVSGRAAYWPARPSPRTAEGHRAWRWVADLVDRRPRRVWVSTLIPLLAAAAFMPTLNTHGLSLDEIFVNETSSVQAREVLSEHFPGGAGQPAIVITGARQADEVLRTARDVRGVAAANRIPPVVDGRVRLQVTLDDPADSVAAQRTVERLRTAVHGVPDARALVGGYTAQQLDIQKTAVHDRNVIAPVVLAIILVILFALLRAVLLPLLLVATVALSYLATLGVTALVFQGLLDISGTDAVVPLYGFVFLVALGVDYNIFLMTRVHEEARAYGTREGIRRGLTATGGVITSAGVVLAATFAALVVLPLVFMIQIAFIVAFGVLLDTFAVRSLLVPALTRDIGPLTWWPTRLG